MIEDYSLHSVLERMYQNQLALEAALMELTLHAEVRGLEEVGENIRGALSRRLYQSGASQAQRQSNLKTCPFGVRSWQCMPFTKSASFL